MLFCSFPLPWTGARTHGDWPARTSRARPPISWWRTLTEALGLVKGHTIYAIWLGKDISALVRLVLGGELTEYTEMMGKARDVALQRMLQEAVELGADAVVNVRFMTTSVIGSAAELLVYGTAVRLAPPST